MADSESNTLSLLTAEEENAHHHHHHHLSIFTSTTSSPSLSSCSSSSSSSSTVEDLVLAVSSKKVGDINGGQVEDDDEIGYHTPTSPNHRIPPSIDCPPAPKKPVEGSQRRKRKAAWSGRREWFHFELMSSFMEVDGVWLMMKKVRREEEINESY